MNYTGEHTQGLRTVDGSQRCDCGLTPVRVVVCDDSADMRSAIEVVFADRADYRVVAQAGDTDAAWEAICRTRPDVVILDARMPGSAVTVVERVAAMAVSPQVIVFSAATSGRDRSELLAAGANEYVVKTGRLGPLLAAMDRAAHQARHRLLTAPRDCNDAGPMGAFTQMTTHRAAS